VQAHVRMSRSSSSNDAQGKAYTEKPNQAVVPQQAGFMHGTA